MEVFNCDKSGKIFINYISFQDLRSSSKLCTLKLKLNLRSGTFFLFKQLAIIVKY